MTTETAKYEDHVASMHCDQPEVPEFERFARDLAVYACKWVPRCQAAIARHAREIFEDATMRELVGRYSKLAASAEKVARFEFVEACIGEDADGIEEGGFERDQMKAYSTVLDALIFDRYCK